MKVRTLKLNSPGERDQGETIEAAVLKQKMSALIAKEPGIGQTNAATAQEEETAVVGETEDTVADAGATLEAVAGIDIGEEAEAGKTEDTASEEKSHILPEVDQESNTLFHSVY